MSILWKPASYNEGWWTELPRGRSAWIYRPTGGRSVRKCNYLVVSVHFPDDPARCLCRHLTGQDPETFLPEATRFLESEGLVLPDGTTVFPEAVALIQPSFL